MMARLESTFRGPQIPARFRNSSKVSQYLFLFMSTHQRVINDFIIHLKTSAERQVQFAELFSEKMISEKFSSNYLHHP